MVVSLERDLCLSYTLHTLTFSMRTNSVLTPCKQGAVLSRYSLGLFNENKLRTHTLQATCGTLLTSEYLLTFPFRLVRTPYSHLASKVRYFHVTPLALRTNFPLKPGRAATDETVGRAAHKKLSVGNETLHVASDIFQALFK